MEDNPLFREQFATTLAAIMDKARKDDPNIMALEYATKVIPAPRCDNEAGGLANMVVVELGGQG